VWHAPCATHSRRIAWTGVVRGSRPDGWSCAGGGDRGCDEGGTTMRRMWREGSATWWRWEAMHRWPARAAFTMLLATLVAGGFAGGRPAAAADPVAATPDSAATPGGAVTTVAPPRGRSLDAERDPGAGPRPHEPVFFDPMATTTEHVRAGLSSWITPNAPFDHREDPGGVAIGLTITWPAPRRDVAPSGPNPWRGSAAR
jgi:hypothetical protein